jgi:spermidine synthase
VERGRESRAALLAFLTAFVTLFVQVLVHRMVSAKLVNNYAFLVISLTMLGFASSAVLLTRQRARLSNAERVFSWSAPLFALTLLGTSLAFYRAPSPSNVVFSRTDVVLHLLSCLPWALLFAVPFFFCGLILGALLSDPRLPTRRIYFFDLLGSAAGAVAVIPSISAFGVERSVAGAALALLAGRLVLPSAERRLAPLGAVASAALALLGAVFADRIFVMSYPAASLLGLTQVPGSGFALERVLWDPIARIEVMRTPPPHPDTFNWPALVGTNHAFHSRFRRMLTQNNNAFTYAVDYDGDVGSLRGIEETIYAAAYSATSVKRPRVLVIGVGGGFDILTGLRFGASELTGVEVNGATLGILNRHYRDYFRSWMSDPRVRVVHEEGRHFLAARPTLYDVLQLSGVDSVSGTPGAAHVFSENYLYSSEAFDLYLSRLSEQGIVNVMRPEYDPPREMLRVLVTGVESLRRRGVKDPARHAVMIASGSANFTAMLLKQSPFTPEEVRRLQEWTSASRTFLLAAAPGTSPPANLYQAYLGLGDPRRERAFVAAFPFDVRPTTDDRPFFFRFSRWSHLWSGDPVVRASLPMLEYSLLILLAVTALAAVLCVYLPLRHLAREGRALPQAPRLTAYFAALGVGYLAIEMALLQKFGLLLGHPNYALSVVLASLLFTTGLGSLWAKPIVAAFGNLRFVSYALAVVILLEYVAVFPRLPSLLAWPFALRVLVVASLVTPFGLCLGTFFPWVLDRLKDGAASFAPWAWGVNGIFSVVAPTLSVAVSVTFGTAVLLLAAAPIYLLGTLLLPPPLARPVADRATADAPL